MGRQEAAGLICLALCLGAALVDAQAATEST